MRVNDQPHMRCFLRALQYWGFEPRVVVTDGSNLYPAVLTEVWPAARHQLCVFHVLQDLTNQVLAGVRRLRRAQANRGKAGRKRPRGRQRKGRAAAAAEEQGEGGVRVQAPLPDRQAPGADRAPGAEGPGADAGATSPLCDSCGTSSTGWTSCSTPGKASTRRGAAGGLIRDAAVPGRAGAAEALGMLRRRSSPR